MTFQQLVKKLCAKEGKKHGVNIADMSEIVACLIAILQEEGHFIVNCHTKLKRRRAKGTKKK